MLDLNLMDIEEQVRGFRALKENIFFNKIFETLKNESLRHSQDIFSPDEAGSVCSLVSREQKIGEVRGLLRGETVLNLTINELKARIEERQNEKIPV